MIDDRGLLFLGHPVYIYLLIVIRMALANMPPLSLTTDSREKPAIISDQMLNEISTFLCNLSQYVTCILSRYHCSYYE